MYLVDTNVISAGAPSRSALPALIAWMDHHSPQLYVSAVTVAEIGDGIAKARREGATRKASDLEAWLDTLLHLYGERVLSFDAATARLAGILSDRARGQGQAPGFADIIIAATAMQHGLTVLSRNLKHFEPLGVAALDPFAALPTTR
uniref:Ribonuclease VapC n=1 Tax=Rhodopseudomonas palustris (strain BisA53) TaxID=316055 RepID=Q07L18_RHOP5